MIYSTLVNIKDASVSKYKYNSRHSGLQIAQQPKSITGMLEEEENHKPAAARSIVSWHMEDLVKLIF